LPDFHLGTSSHEDIVSPTQTEPRAPIEQSGVMAKRAPIEQSGVMAKRAPIEQSCVMANARADRTIRRDGERAPIEQWRWQHRMLHLFSSPGVLCLG
jgi:hypothetical protein